MVRFPSWMVFRLSESSANETWFMFWHRTATLQTTIAQAMSAMTAGRFRHLPVMDGGRLIGIISIGDVVKARLDEQQYEVENLRSYVVGVG